MDRTEEILKRLDTNRCATCRKLLKEYRSAASTAENHPRLRLQVSVRVQRLNDRAAAHLVTC